MCLLAGVRTVDTPVAKAVSSVDSFVDDWVRRLGRKDTRLTPAPKVAARSEHVVDDRVRVLVFGGTRGLSFRLRGGDWLQDTRVTPVSKVAARSEFAVDA